MTSPENSRRKRTGWRATEQRLHERKTRKESVTERRPAEQRGVEPARERDDQFAAETDIERAASPHGRKGPTLCGD